MAPDYPAPFDQLLSLGKPSSEEAPDYRAMGVGPEHIPALIRLAVDEELRWGDSEDPAIWAQVHAWYALGQLRAVEAIPALLKELKYVDGEGDDWAAEEIPDILGQIGPAALPSIETYVLSRSNGQWARVSAGEALKAIAIRHPEAREACIQSLTRVIEAEGGRNRELLGFVAVSLAQLKAVEAAPILTRAFENNWVEESIGGDWEDLQIEMGLRALRTKPREKFNMLERLATNEPKKKRVRRRRRKA